MAAIASAAMLAQQVAGKATRDALFLSNFSVKALPVMMGVSSVASLLVVLWLSRMMLRYTPARVVPVGFGASALVLLATWGLSFPTPRLAAIVLYLYTSLFGAAMISSFWSLIDETFDPHTSRRSTTAIAAGGTLGGLFGALAAWRMSSFIDVPTMLPLMAVASLVSLWGTLNLRREAAITAVGVETASDAALAPLRSLRGAPHLQNLAAIVALVALTSGLLDYVFSAEARRSFSTGPALLAFFSCFWLVVGVASFVVQALLGRLALEKLGVVRTVALMPAVVVLGGAAALAVPGLWSVAILRGGEATQRNSLFRAAYEMLCTPLSEEKRRSTKTLIDVGFDRLGTVAAAGVVMVALWVAGARAETVLVVVAIAGAGVMLARARALHRGHVLVLEERLRDEADPAVVSDERLTLRDAVVERLETPRPTGQSSSGLASLSAAADLCSSDPVRVRRALSAEAPLAPPLVSFAILLLADKVVHADAIRALRKCAPRATGQLVDALCDHGTELDIRRRIPRVLSECPTQAAAEGLVRGIGDERFEVRYECGRALLKITDRDHRIVIAPERIIAMVKQEISLNKNVWESQQGPELDEEEDAVPGLVDRLLRDRVDRSLEHVFTLLAVNLDTQSLRLAFSALHDGNERLRGTALEYLETVLPDEVRDAVWPFLGEERPMRPTRSALEILADLRRSPGAVAIVHVGQPR